MCLQVSFFDPLTRNVCLIFFYNLLSYVNFVVFTVLCSRPEHVSNFVDAESFFGPVFYSYVFYLL
jgi:hypothetical protein